ncbi:hypothetical protein D3C87_2112400 [compost metagenome]
MLHHAIRVGADHRQFPGKPELGAVAIHFGGVVIGVEIGHDNDFGFFRPGTLEVEPFVKRIVLGRGTDMMNSPPAIF